MEEVNPCGQTLRIDAQLSWEVCLMFDEKLKTESLNEYEDAETLFLMK
jgi:hypothetical protein